MVKRILEKTVKLRRRATAVVYRRGRVLLVRDKGKRRYSLPGGGARKNEPTLATAVRELYEETHLKAIKAERDPSLDFKGKVSKHEVCLIEARGSITLNTKELSDYVWVDYRKPLKVPVYPHVRYILKSFSKKKVRKPKT